MERQEESLAIYCFQECWLPHVNIECEGVACSFIIDSGCRMSRITTSQMAALGFEMDDLLPYHGHEPQVLGLLRIQFKFSNVQRWKYFGVTDTYINLLGLDVLSAFCCVIDLSEMRLTVREPVSRRALLMPKATVNIQGRDVEAEIDTGTVLPLIGPLSLAQELNLPLEAVTGF